MLRLKQLLDIDRVSVPSPIAFEMLIDAMARDRAAFYLTITWDIVWGSIACHK